jgi:hypothetical protein
VNARIKITELNKPSLTEANVWISGKLHPIYFSTDKASGFVIDVTAAILVGDHVELAQGPAKGLGSGIVTELLY